MRIPIFLSSLMIIAAATNAQAAEQNNDIDMSDPMAVYTAAGVQGGKRYGC